MINGCGPLKFEETCSRGDDFLRTIDAGDKDALRWVCANSGIYSAKRFCELEFTLNSRPLKIWNLVWTGLAPPKVEGILWKVIQGRIPTFEELNKHEALSVSSILCVFCSRHEKSINHIFCHCDVVWKVWMRNDVIFNNFLCNEKKIYEAAIFKLDYWCKCEWSDSTYSITEFIRNLYFIASETIRDISFI
ncbi:hypothetical protein GQ457_04G010750 [Hibiscus cannabinus]